MLLPQDRATRAPAPGSNVPSHRSARVSDSYAAVRERDLTRASPTATTADECRRRCGLVPGGHQVVAISARPARDRHLATWTNERLRCSEPKSPKLRTTFRWAVLPRHGRGREFKSPTAHAKGLVRAHSIPLRPTAHVRRPSSCPSLGVKGLRITAGSRGLSVKLYALTLVAAIAASKTAWDYTMGSRCGASPRRWGPSSKLWTRRPFVEVGFHLVRSCRDRLTLQACARPHAAVRGTVRRRLLHRARSTYNIHSQYLTRARSRVHGCEARTTGVMSRLQTKGGL
jgi:hypothetical protein